ncbi:MAG: glycosyltransferase [Cyanobacteria bacterium P01_A01_bin.68]
MILVTVGTEQFPFNRLMGWIEGLLECGAIQEEVVVQAGSCTVTPENTTCHTVLPEVQFKELVRAARVVISHCGEGSYLLFSQLQVPFVLVPRSARFGEHVDDHQVELADALGDLGMPIARSPFELLSHLARPMPPSQCLKPSESANNFCRMLRQTFPVC